MQAVMKVAPGEGNVELREIPEPYPHPKQVVIEVSAAGICGTDIHIFHGEFKTTPPVVLGHEVAGRVVQLGSEVEGVELGSRVTTETYFETCTACRYCRDGHLNLCPKRRSIGSAVDGGFTKYLAVPATNVHVLPENVELYAGALTEPLACVVHGVLGTPTVHPGDVAIIAGPGAIGLLALQVVKAAGAVVAVLGTARDEARLALARSLGADYTFDVSENDYADSLLNLTQGGHGADVVYECSGAGSAAQHLLSLVRRRGRYVQIGLFGKPVSWDIDQLCYKELVVTGSNASTPAAWHRALALLGRGQVETAPLISATYPLSEWALAFEAFEGKRGTKLLLLPET